MPEHHSLDAAIAWVNATTEALDREDVPLPTARGRVLTEAIRAPGPIPGNNRAALNGFAVESSASLEASSYNPIQLPLIGVAARDVLPASYLPYVASGLRRVWRRRVRSRLLSHKIYYRSRKGKGRFSVPTEFFTEPLGVHGAARSSQRTRTHKRAY